MYKKQTILIIDDIEENINIMERQLTAERFNIFTADEGSKGLHVLKKTTY